ncbi:fibronectin type III domain-containing protein [Candidatus Gottesmanbacteria bacterium]|nr:fibronectin type III domain-containing protein [Candidatus Gottesmanbacteria bacterium]
MNLASFQKNIKTIGIAVLLLIVLGVTIVLGRKANIFLAKASTCNVKDVGVDQVTTNNAAIIWATDDMSQGTVEYGTSATNLTFSSPEVQPGKAHNINLSLLTPNTVYYYLIKIGDKRCDASGQICGASCVPWSFTTTAIIPQKEIVKPIDTPTPYLSPTVVVTSPTKTASATATPKITSTSPSGTSSLCAEIPANMGKNDKESDWSSFKKYDIDGSGRIDTLDKIKCK